MRKALTIFLLITLSPLSSADYLLPCEEKLILSQEGNAEKHFLKGVDSDADAEQLLDDYGILPSQEFVAAVDRVLEKHGAKINEWDRETVKTMPVYQSYFQNTVGQQIKVIKSLVSTDGKKLEPLVWEVLDILVNEAGAMTGRETVGPAVANLVAAMKTSKQGKYLVRTLSLRIQQIMIEPLFDVAGLWKDGTDYALIREIIGICSILTGCGVVIAVRTNPAISEFAFFGFFSVIPAIVGYSHVARWFLQRRVNPPSQILRLLKDPLRMTQEQIVALQSSGTLIRLVKSDQEVGQTPSVGDLTPPQITYLGHADRAAADTARALHVQNYGEDALKVLVLRAIAVTDQFNESVTPQKRSELMNAMVQLADFLRGGRQSLRQIVEQLQTNIVKREDGPHTLRSAAYQVGRDPITPEVLTKGRLLKARMDLDREFFESLLATDRKALSIFDSLQDVTVHLESLMSTLTDESSHSDWAEAARSVGQLLRQKFQ
jgi:hypothetical protein